VRDTVLPRQLAVGLRLLPFPGLRWASVWLAPGHRQTHGHKTADALDTPRRPPSAPGRTRVLNDQLADDLQRWYSGLSRAVDTVALAA
jgi:hypothetical protein